MRDRLDDPPLTVARSRPGTVASFRTTAPTPTVSHSTSYLGEFEQLILFSVLELGDQAYGVAIREMIEERTGKAVSSGAIYTALGRLGDRGFVSFRVESGEGRVGRPRKYYTLEPPGARALKAAYTRVQAMAVGLLPKLSRLAEQ